METNERQRLSEAHFRSRFARNRPAEAVNTKQTSSRSFYNPTLALDGEIINTILQFKFVMDKNKKAKNVEILAAAREVRAHQTWQ